jgi:MFS family permease
MRERSGLWAHADFLKLWAAQTVSQAGSQVTQLGLPFAAVVVLHASALEVSLLGTAAILPFVLFALPAGVWVDRLRRKPLMVAADFGRLAVLASIPIAHAFDALTLGQLYACEFTAGVLTVFFDVSYLSYLPSLVSREELAAGNAKLETTRAAAQTAGPGLAGGLIGLVGAPAAITADAVSFGISGALISLIRRPERVAPRADREPLARELGEGLRYVFGQRYLRMLTICTGTWNLFGSIVFGLFVVYGVRSLGLSAPLLGLIFMIGSIGAAVAAMLSAQAVRRIGLGPTIVWPGILGSVFFVLAPLAHRSTAVPFLIVGIVGASALGMLFNVNQLTLRQAITPASLQGRMNAIVRFMYWGPQVIGFAAGGALASSIGLRGAIWVGVAGSTLAMTPLAFSSVRRIERLPEPAEPSEPPLPEPPAVLGAADA